MTYDEFKQNFLPELNRINSYAGRLRYAKQHLQGIGSGSGRAVFDIDGEKALKLAKNAKGIAQNDVEGYAGRDNYTKGIVATVFEYAQDDSWIVSEKAKKVNEKRIKELTDIPSLYELRAFLQNTIDLNHNRKPSFKLRNGLKEFFWENEFSYALVDFVVNYNQHVGDMGRPSTYGEVIHDGQPTIILTDYGLNDEVYNTQYKTKQQYIYELYNFADGNDDILSDMGGGNDVRVGFAAISPSSDNMGVIDENFIKLVSNVNKYPDRPVEGLPLLTDKFHECINNLKETLDQVKNKRQFYGNLIELQNYLIRRGMWDRPPLNPIIEDGSAKFSTDDAMGQDGFPPYNNNDTSPSINNDLDANVAMYEDLEYKHVDGDATDDEYMIGEDVIPYSSEGDYDDESDYDLDLVLNQIDDVVRRSGINILSDKELSGFVLKDNIVAGAIFSSVSNNEYSFDVVVDDKFKRMGIGKELVQFGIDEFNDLSDVYEDLKLNLDVVNPYMRDLLKKHFNFNDVNKISNDRYNMSMNERDKSYGTGSKTVKVKKKCQLGGLGNTSVACNQGDINNLEFGSVSETIDIDTVNGYNDKDMLNHMVNGDKDVGFIRFDDDYSEYITGIVMDNKFKTVPIQQTDHNYDQRIVYRDTPEAEKKARRLIEILKSHGGYFNDQTPEEAREIGTLLDYSDESIREYIGRRYPRYSTAQPEPSVDDFDYLDENYLEIKEYFSSLVPQIDEMSIQSVNSNSIVTPEYIEEIKNSDRFERYVEEYKYEEGKTDLDNEEIEQTEDFQNWFKYELQYRYENVIEKLSDIIKPDNTIDIWRTMTVTEKWLEELQTSGKHLGIYWSWDENAAEAHWGRPANVTILIKSSVREDYINWHDTIILNMDITLGEDEKEIRLFKNTKLKIEELYVDGENIIDMPEYGLIKNKTFLAEETQDNKNVTNTENDNIIDMINETDIMSLQDLPFKQEIEDIGGQIFSVGGAVRDEFLGKESKDLDILITGVPMNTLEQLLSKYGGVNAVGKSFGVIKFIPKGASEEIDIAIPRTEVATGEGGHKGFDVTSDHELPIEKDLERRDFTINAIAKDIDGNLIDPFNGQEDLKNKIIRIVNPEAFSDDPLRMLRAVQFASRFGFTIEPTTMETIKDNAAKITEIAPERILIELDKIITKGQPHIGIELLSSTGLFKQIFGNEINSEQIANRDFSSVRTMAEFLFFMMDGVVQNPSEFYLKRFSTLDAKRDKTYKELQALDLAFNTDPVMTPVKARTIAHNMYSIAPQTLESQILPEPVRTATQELLQGKYPKTTRELAVNGNDLMQRGLQGKAIGDMQKSMLIRIYNDKIRNDKEELLSLVREKSNDVQETVEDKVKSWDINGKQETIEFFIKKFDTWNRKKGNTVPTKNSVLKFLEDNYEDQSTNDGLKRNLFNALIDRDLLGEEMEKKQVYYSAVVLDDKSRASLLKVFSPMIPEGWETIAHHMTINLGALEDGSQAQEDMENNIEISLKVVDYAIDNLVMAVGVEGYETNNKKSHITIAVNRAEGGKPYLSNKLQDWKPINFPLVLTGKVSEE